MRWERITYDRLIGRFRERQEGTLNLIRGRHANFLMEREKRTRDLGIPRSSAHRSHPNDLRQSALCSVPCSEQFDEVGTEPGVTRIRPEERRGGGGYRSTVTQSSVSDATQGV